MHLSVARGRSYLHHARSRKFAVRHAAKVPIGGIVAGVAVVVVTTMMPLSIGLMFPLLRDAAKDINIGFLALTLNIIALVAVSALTRRVRCRS